MLQISWHFNSNLDGEEEEAIGGIKRFGSIFWFEKVLSQIPSDVPKYSL
jgi:hypothetical protein